ncbi:Lamin tail domain-containing protein 1 [Apodemus speciosus]|uniref:Lamin tail domain-containing protein 1 n=1 Tax=Apodemus speciosus TaxID=105296 RepID=A0ABQ0EWM1_APOSI
MEREEAPPLLAKMKEASEPLTSATNINKQDSKIRDEETREEKVGTITPPKQHSSVHFFPKILDSSSTLLPLSRSFSQEMPVSFYQMPSAQDSGFTLSSGVPLTSKSTIVSCSHKDSSLGKQSTSFTILKRHPQLSSDLDTYVLGDGEDYFLSLFGESKKLTARTSQTEDVSKHLSVILEEVGQFTSSSLGDIKIAEVNVKGFFVRLVNSSNEKEVEIGNHILQQNVSGHAVSLYRFPHNVTLQASSTVTVWAAASEAKPQPPTDFLWDEQSRFRSSPDCTTILCNPSGEAIAWYTPIHWKQAWEKLETDIEFERCSVVIPSMRSHMFGWTTASASSIKKEIPPTVLPNKSPWCRNPDTSPHPYSSLIDSQDSDVSESRLGTQLKPQSTKPKPDPVHKDLSAMPRAPPYKAWHTVTVLIVTAADMETDGTLPLMVQLLSQPVSSRTMRHLILRKTVSEGWHLRLTMTDTCTIFKTQRSRETQTTGFGGDQEKEIKAIRKWEAMKSVNTGSGDVALG